MFGPSSAASRCDRVLPRLRVERDPLHVGVHHRAERAVERAQRLEERRHRLLAIVPIRQRAKLGVAGWIDLRGAAVAQRDRRIREIGVREDVVDVVSRCRERHRVRENLFLRVRQCVRGPARDVMQVERIDRQARRRFDEPFERVDADVQQLRFDIRHLHLEVGRELLHLLLHALRTRFARVLIGEHPGINREARDLFIQP